MESIRKIEIDQIISVSGLKGFSGEYRELGGGEINDTFLLACEPDPVVLRVAKHTDQNSLEREAKALSLLSSSQIPKLLYFDSENRVLGRHWILESYIPGISVVRLSLKQFENFGSLLAQVHRIQSEKETLNLWEKFLESCKMFGDEQFLLSHPNSRLEALVRKSSILFSELQTQFSDIRMSLVHGDATPSNVLTQGDQVALIDWEMSRYNDPMAEFATIYYEDIEYNQGKWRTKITEEEKNSLFAGYTSNGGVINEDRIRFWINYDKLGAVLFLYWRLYDSGRDASPSQIAQYELDLENLTTSLERNL